MSTETILTGVAYNLALNYFFSSKLPGSVTQCVVFSEHIISSEYPSTCISVGSKLLLILWVIFCLHLLPVIPTGIEKIYMEEEYIIFAFKIFFSIIVIAVQLIIYLLVTRDRVQEHNKIYL